MGLEQNSAQQYREVVDKYVNPVASYQMTTRDYVVRPNSAAGAMTITLPSVSEARGRTYSILARSADGTKTITITDKNDSESFTDLVMKLTADRLVLYSDGLAWFELLSDLTA